MFAKIDVNGDQTAELYQWLKSEAPGDGDSSDIVWNFEKFLVGRDGKLIGRYSSGTRPDTETLTAEIIKALWPS